MPIDFSLTEEQRQLQALARRFAKEVILPVAREYDEKEEVPWPVIEKLHEVGLLNAIIPEEYGGMGLKMLDEVIVGEWGAAVFSDVLAEHLQVQQEVAAVAKTVGAAEEEAAVE